MLEARTKYGAEVVHLELLDSCLEHQQEGSVIPRPRVNFLSNVRVLGLVDELCQRAVVAALHLFIGGQSNDRQNDVLRKYISRTQDF